MASISSSAVATVNRTTSAQASMVAPFTGLKSNVAFPVTKKSNDFSSLPSTKTHTHTHTMNCSISGEVPEEPVVSKSSGLLFEKRLIERHIIMLRDEDGRKAGLKLKEKSSAAVDKDVKMSDAEGPSNESGESSKASSGEGVASDKNEQLTGLYDLVAVLTHKLSKHIMR